MVQMSEMVKQEYSQMGRRNKRANISEEKSLPSPRKLSFDIDDPAIKATPEKSKTAPEDEVIITEVDEIPRSKRKPMTIEEVNYKYRNCVPLEQEHPDAYGGGYMKEFGGYSRRKYRTLKRA